MLKCFLGWDSLFICSLVISTEVDILPFVVTFLMSFWQVQYGIIGGVAVSGALLLYSTARPKITVQKHLNSFENKQFEHYL